jgi:hypothetical protein
MFGGLLDRHPPLQWRFKADLGHEAIADDRAMAGSVSNPQLISKSSSSKPRFQISTF